MRSYKEVKNLFKQRLRGGVSGIAKSTIERAVRRFHKRGTVRDLPRSGRPRSAGNDENSLNVLLSFIEDPYTSIRMAA